jgi:carboxypeptidase C (cathepsin A)
MLPGARRTAATLVVLMSAAAGLPAQNLTAPLDTVVTSEHSVTIDGQRVPYRASAGHQPVFDAAGEPIASLFYVYYERSDVRDRTQRPS